MADDILSPRHRAFVTAYVGEAKFNGCRAAGIAGYKANGVGIRETAHRLLTNADIRAEIKRIVAERAMTPEQCLDHLADQARGIADFLDDDTLQIDTRALKKAGLGHLIKGTRPTKYGMVVELCDPQTALIQIGRAHKLFTDNIDLRGLTDDQLRSLLSGPAQGPGGGGGEAPGAGGGNRAEEAGSGDPL